ncbi:hypothetical protein HHI36_005341 [Cryptolaemus montrouzieri]|uniref:Uncharacterized protein n=1 Tax=Cryptolaemus montrouzieri TaxID=559131 RepID=A0ABD2NUW8_9CUCU
MISIDFLNGLWEQHYTLWKSELGIRIQASVTSLIYRKTLKINHSRVAEISTGKIITAITKDVASLNAAILFGLDLLSEILQIVCVSFLLYYKIGVTAMVGVTVIGLSILCQVFSARKTYYGRLDCFKKSEERLEKTKEVLSSLSLVKMYTWEEYFKKEIMKVRRIELAYLRRTFLWDNLSFILGMTSGRIALTLILLIQYLTGRILNSDVIYYSMKLFQKVSKSMIFISTAIDSLSLLMMASTRITIILNSEETTPHQNVDNAMNSTIIFDNASVGTGKLEILKNLNVKLTVGLNFIMGPSGSGKSTLLKSILDEYILISGEIKFRGTVSYAAQIPWVFPGSLKQNIIFGQTFDETKYKKILEICCLDQDIKVLPRYDETILTDGGANLSGGQKARLNLARALYKNSDIYLLDDCLASLDPHVTNYIFNKAVKEYLVGKMCLLVTHKTKFLDQADNIVIMEKGTMRYSGTYDYIPEDFLQKYEKTEFIDEDKMPILELDNIEEKMDEIDDSTALIENKGKQRENIYNESKNNGQVDFKVYNNYFNFGGGLIMVTSILFLHIICESSFALSEKFISEWLNHDMSNTILNNETTMNPDNSKSDFFEFNYFTLFIAAIAISTIFVIIRAVVTFHLSLTASANIHESMINNVLKGKMNFFHTHLIGNILTRFSKDLFMVDGVIPYAWQSFRNIFILAMSMFLIASVDSLFAMLSVIVAIIFYCLCDYILSTTRNLQRLSTSSLSPMIGYINSTIDGLIVIRAYRTQQILRDEFDKYLNVYISASHLREITTRVLGLYSHLITTLFNAFIMFQLFYFEKGTLSGDVGLVLTQVNALCTFLEWSLMLWMWTENTMTNVERVLEYTKLPKENSSGLVKENWPKKGGIEFKNVNLSYRENEKVILRNLNFSIHHQEKIGIVGRTGAGKSSVIMTLFKMYDFEGEILIDDIDIRTISSEFLRRQLGIIPQEPLIFSGTLRDNIDPFHREQDDAVWKAIEEVGLKSYCKNLYEDLTTKNLTIGQKQLICLARVLIKNVKVIIMDEATANMDEKMDSFIQDKIRTLFQSCTVITIAHRLNTIMNSDRIIVMNKGEIVEFDSPSSLLKSNGLFREMVNQE